MRYNIAYYLFLLYNLVLFRPAIPLISDAIAHSFALSIHLATVHAKYGSHHLEKELANTSSDNAKKNNGVKSEVTSPVHVPTQEGKYCFYTDPSKCFPALQLPHIEPIFISVQSPPPRFS